MPKDTNTIFKKEFKGNMDHKVVSKILIKKEKKRNVAEQHICNIKQLPRSLSFRDTTT